MDPFSSALLKHGTNYLVNTAKKAKKSYDTSLEEYKKDMARNLKIINDDIGYRTEKTPQYNLFDKKD